jgi:putative transposase
MAIRERMYPKEQQFAVLRMHCDHARLLYNVGLEQRNMWRRWHKGRRPNINMATQMRELTAARAEFDWLREGSTVIQQGALRDLDRAFANWWKDPAQYKHPTRRKKHNRQLFVVRDVIVRQLNRKNAEVLIPKIGWVAFRISRPFKQIAAASSARVILDTGRRWHISFTTPAVPFERTSTGTSAGVDRGIVNSLALNTGLMLHAPSLTPGEQGRYLTLARRLARQWKGSKRRNATKDAMGKLTTRLADRRKDWVEQTTTALVRHFDVVVIEDLKTTNMVGRPKPNPDPDNPGQFLPNGAAAKTGLNKGILGSCWGMFGVRLNQKAARTPIESPCVVLEVNPRNTSRECNECHFVGAGNRESQAVFQCQRCGHYAHADTHAAQNIHDKGINNAREKLANRRTVGDRARQSSKRSRVNHQKAA